MTHNEEKNQSIQTDPEMIQMIALVDKAIKNNCNYIPHSI